MFYCFFLLPFPHFPFSLVFFNFILSWSFHFPWECCYYYCYCYCYWYSYSCYYIMVVAGSAVTLNKGPGGFVWFCFIFHLILISASVLYLLSCSFLLYSSIDVEHSYRSSIRFGLMRNKYICDSPRLFFCHGLDYLLSCTTHQCCSPSVARPAPDQW